MIFLKNVKSSPANQNVDKGVYRDIISVSQGGNYEQQGKISNRFNLR